VNKNEPARKTKEMLVAVSEEPFAKISLFLNYGDYSNSPFVVKMHAKQAHREKLLCITSWGPTYNVSIKDTKASFSPSPPPPEHSA
jgi:hypothetical protein